jgi:hypothetical protein
VIGMADLLKVVLINRERGTIFNVSEDCFRKLKRDETLGDKCFEVRKDDGKWEDVKLKDIKLQQE